MRLRYGERMEGRLLPYNSIPYGRYVREWSHGNNFSICERSIHIQYFVQKTQNGSFIIIKGFTEFGNMNFRQKKWPHTQKTIRILRRASPGSFVDNTNVLQYRSVRHESPPLHFTHLGARSTLIFFKVKQFIIYQILLHACVHLFRIKAMNFSTVVSLFLIDRLFGLCPVQHEIEDTGDIGDRSQKGAVCTKCWCHGPLACAKQCWYVLKKMMPSSAPLNSILIYDMFKTLPLILLFETFVIINTGV
jgi:hypothetical protein